MEKVIFSFSDKHDTYIVEEQFWTNDYRVASVKEVLQVVARWQGDIKNTYTPDELVYQGIEFEYMTHLQELWIWSAFLIKKQEYKKFETIEEHIVYDNAYRQYYDKRWDEIPKIKIAIEHWENLQHQWTHILADKPKYLIFILDDLKSSNKIEIICKNDLSEQDIEYIQHEHEKYLKYQKAREEYIAHQPDYSLDLWRGPQDDEYEADIMKYYKE
ncbi:hypothetical protein KBD08_02170 [Candidatus Babeliales bacterium]|nr:hypothetical protein [Candidatus Babeliales bacterium]